MENLLSVSTLVKKSGGDNALTYLLFNAIFDGSW